MTDSKGNNEFCFPEALDIEVEGKKLIIIIKSLLYLSIQNYKKLRRIVLLYPGWLINLPRFQGASGT